MAYKITDKGIEKLINLYDVKSPGAIGTAEIAMLEYMEEKKENANFIGMRKAWRESLGFTPTDMRIRLSGDRKFHRAIDDCVALGYILRY